MATALLWLFVINLGIALGAGLYEHTIVVPEWIGLGADGLPHWDAEAARSADTGRRFWVYVTTVPLTLLTLANLMTAWRFKGPARYPWLGAAVAALADRAITFGYFIPTMFGLMAASDSAESVATAQLWSLLNYGRHLLVLEPGLQPSGHSLWCTAHRKSPGRWRAERMSGARIETFNADMTAGAARMLARAFVTNPLHVVAFGANELAKNEAFFRVGLTVMKGPKFVALDGSRILGFIHWVHAPRCQVSAVEKLKMTPAMISGFGVRSALRVSAWLSVWSTHDPHQPHVHLGPIGVDPAAQGRRIGHQLMERYCEQLDRRSEEGYLETDRAENVTFYARFGFETAAEIPVLGVPNYLMSRAKST